MGYIKEPKGIDLIVEPSVLTEMDKIRIGNIVANYKSTGKIPPSIKQEKKPSRLLTHSLKRKKIKA